MIYLLTSKSSVLQSYTTHSTNLTSFAYQEYNLTYDHSSTNPALLKSSESHRFILYFHEMDTLPKSQICRFTEEMIHLARRAVSRYSSKFSKHRYTLSQHIILLCLKVKENTTYRTLLDEPIKMSCIRSAIDLTELPFSSTLCKAFNQFDMTV